MQRLSVVALAAIAFVSTSCGASSDEGSSFGIPTTLDAGTTAGADTTSGADSTTGADDPIADFQRMIDATIGSADFDEVGEAALIECPLTTWQELAPGAGVNLEDTAVERVQSSADDGSDVFPPLVRCRFDLSNGGTVYLDAFQEPYDSYNGKPFTETLMNAMGGEGLFSGPTEVPPSGVVYGYCENDGRRCAATWVSSTTQLSLLGPADFGARGEYADWMAAFIDRKFG